MKITVGSGVEADRDRIRTIAAALPDGFGFSMDANTSYGFSDALRLARTASELEMEWFEEPISHTDIEGQAELNRRVDVPIAAYQSHYPHYPAVDHLRANALEVYQPSLYACGGVTAGVRVAAMVEAFGKRFVPHAFGPLVNYAASLHVSVASPACKPSSSPYTTTKSTIPDSTSPVRTSRIKTNSDSKTAAYRHRTDRDWASNSTTIVSSRSESISSFRTDRSLNRYFA